MNAYSRLSRYYANQHMKKLRELLRRDYGARCYRITSSGNVDIFGEMPHSAESGWWFKGSLREVMTDYCL